MIHKKKKNFFFSKFHVFFALKFYFINKDTINHIINTIIDIIYNIIMNIIKIKINIINY
jgi:hypothetical protein